MPIILMTLAACAPTSPLEPDSDQPARLNALLSEHRYSEAAALLEEMSAAAPADAAPLNKIGQIYLKQQRWLLAEDAFNRALAQTPRHALAAAGLAEVKLNQGDWVKSLQLWQQAADIDPNLPGVFTGLGRTYLFRLDFQAASAAFRRQQSHTADPEAQWYLAALTAPLDVTAANDYLLAIPLTAPTDILSRRDYLLATLVPFTTDSPPGAVARATGIALSQAEAWPLAIYALQQAEAAGGQSPQEEAETLAFLGHGLAQMGQPAFDVFTQARQLNPKSALPLYFYGLYLRRQNALTAAEQQFRQAIELDPANAASYAELALTKAQQGDFAAAEAQFDMAVSLAGDDAAIPLLRVKFYAGRGYRVAEMGIPAAKALLEDSPGNAEAHDWLGWMYFLTGQTTEAESEFRQAIELAPELVQARYHLARLLEPSAPEETLDQYRQVVDLDLTEEYRALALKKLQQLENR
jgi:tetratricopeptide (TPR) repeat protein